MCVLGAGLCFCPCFFVHGCMCPVCVSFFRILDLRPVVLRCVALYVSMGFIRVHKVMYACGICACVPTAWLVCSLRVLGFVSRVSGIRVFRLIFAFPCLYTSTTYQVPGTVFVPQVCPSRPPPPPTHPPPILYRLGWRRLATTL